MDRPAVPTLATFFNFTSVTNSETCPIVGLVGGVGSGKSSIAQSLAERSDAVAIDGDAAGHRALADDRIQAALRDRFGEGIFDSDGSIDRGKLAQSVFGASPEHEIARRDLEAITHPFIRAEIQSQIAAAQASAAPVVLLDAAILLETGWRELCSHIVFVDADEQHRRTRAIRRGWTTDQWRDREASQMNLAEKRRHADAVVENNGSISEAIDQMTQALSSWGVDLKDCVPAASPS